MIFAFLNQKAASARPRSPRTSPVNWQCAACTSSCWMPTRRVPHSTGRSGAASRACPGCSAPWALPADAAPGSAGAGPPCRSRRHRRPAQDRRLGALRAAGGRARADPGAAQPYDVWASAEMVSLIREASSLSACAARGLVINRRVSTTIIGRKRGNRWPNSRCPRCARRSTSASSSPTAWPLAGLPAKPRPTAPPHASCRAHR